MSTVDTSSTTTTRSNDLNAMYDQELAAGRTTLDRRTFLRLAGVTSAGLAMLASAGRLASADPATMTADGAVAPDVNADDEDFFADCETYYAACSPECQHHNLCAYVKDGKVVKVGIGKNNESLPCLRGFARVDWLNSQDRLIKPLVRDGEKGGNKWREVSWDEALDLLAGKLTDAIKEDGNESIIFDGHAGNFHTLAGQVSTAFTTRLGGTTTLTGSLCCAAVNGAMTTMWGKRSFDTRNTIAESDYILVWGNNPVVSMGGCWERYEQCMKNGGKVVVIDPVRSESAQQASEWVPVKPTTDTALALGMLKVIVDENLYNENFLFAHSTAATLVDASGAQVLIDETDPTSYAVFDTVSGKLARHDADGVEPALSAAGIPADAGIDTDWRTVFDLTYEQAQPWTPEAVEAETGVPADTVTRLAREYAGAGKAMIIQNMGGFMRVTYGTDAVASQLNLAIFCGQVGRRGTGVYDAGGISNLVKVGAAWDNPKPLEGLPTIPRVKFGEMVCADEPNPIKVFVSYRESPMTQFPNTGAVKEALKKIPFVCVIDQFMTSTALYADLVLPDAAVFETEDLLLSARSHLIQLSEKAVEAPGEAKDDVWIFSQLAQRMGFGEDFQLDNKAYIEKCLEGTGYTYEQLKEEKTVNAMPDDFVPYEGGIFYTDTKKAELYQPAWLKKYHLGVPTYMKAPESVGGDSGLEARYPLAAVQRKIMTSVHSSFANLETIVAMGGGVAHAMLSESDAAARGIVNDDDVVVYNDRGEHKAKVIVTDGIMDGVVCLENGHWEQQGGSSSYVTNDAVGLLAGEHCCNETLVEVRKA